jgi:hypothetical protein
MVGLLMHLAGCKRPGSDLVVGLLARCMPDPKDLI